MNNTEYENKNQNTKWQNVDSTLQAQSNRMLNYKEQLSEMGGIKSKITHMKNTATGMSYEMTNVKSQINEYENGIQHYSTICDKILDTKSNTDNTLDNISY